MISASLFSVVVVEVIHFSAIHAEPVVSSPFLSLSVNMRNCGL